MHLFFSSIASTTVTTYTMTIIFFALIVVLAFLLVLTMAFVVTHITFRHILTYSLL